MESIEEIDIEQVVQDKDDWMEWVVGTPHVSCPKDTNWPLWTTNGVLFQWGIFELGRNAIFER